MMLLLALLVPWAAKAQTTVTIGEGTATSNTNPIGTYYNYSITEQLYTAEEIGTAGTISSISFYYMGIAAKDLPITVYMKHVDEENLASAGITLADAYEVFTGTLSVPATAGWVTINLDTPFDYDGTSNLLIGFIKDYLYYFSGQSWQGTATTSCMARYTQNDYNAYTTSTVPSSAQANRPNIQIEITPSGSGPTCDKPSTLEVTDIAGYSATCTWENTGAASYTFEYKATAASDWRVVTGLTANTYALSGLEPFTAYSVRVKAVCGTDLESGYKSANFTTLDVCPDGKVCIGEGTTTNSYLPTYSYYNYSLTQQIYTAEEIGGAGLIESVDFYCTGAVTRTLDVYMVSTEKDAFESTTDWITVTSADLVFSGSVAFAQGWNTITFDDPFIFRGRTNVALIVDDNSDTWVSAPSFFVFETEEPQAIYVYSDGTNYDPMTPPTSYSSSEYYSTLSLKNRVRLGVSELPSCLQPSGLTVSNIEARQVVLSWTENGDATAWEVEVTGDYATTWTANTNPFTLVGLEPGTDYSVKVRAICGTDNYSDWTSDVTFTTDVLCHTPTNLYADEITAYTAHLSWEGVETTYDLRYAVLPTTRNTTKTVKLTDIINLSSADYNANQQVSAASNARPNGTRGEQLRDGWYYYDNGIYNTSFGASGSMFWATMFPAGTFTENVLTKIAVYEAASYQQPMTVYVCDGETAPENVLYVEEFDVVAGNDFHIVTLADPVIIDPSQNLWLVFDSSDSYPAAVCQYASADENDANNRWCSFDGSTWYDLANVGGAATYGWMIRAYVETIDIDNLTWVEVPSLEAFEYDMTDLTPETHYIAQVRANCGTENGVSNWITTTFTTDPTCLIPTNLAVVGNPTAHTVTLNWTENGDATTWDVEVVGSYTTTWTATEYPYTVVGLEPDTEYSFRVRARCSDTDFSEWSTHVTAVTDIACYAPTSLAVANITGFTANLSWVSDANSCDLRYAPNIENEGDSWLVYDDGVYATNIGSSSASTRTWAVMYPASMLDGNTMLSMLSIYENSNIESNITINIYQGGETAPETLLYTEVVVPMNAGFHNVPLTEPVTIDPTQNLWIALTATGPYVMPACAVNDANNRWICTDGVWQELTSELSDYGWMIRAYVGGALDWVNVTGLTEYQYALANLEPETEYIVQVRSNCEEEGYSWWTEANFTTDVACPAPTTLAATPYANSAVLSWEGISESYTVRYGITEVGETLSSFDFEDETIPADFTNSTSYPWTVTEGGADGSGYCVIPGNAGVNSSTSDLTLQVTGPCAVSFMAKVSSENNWDWGRFLIDGTQQMQISGTKDWESYSYTVAAGTHTLVWRYYKDSSSSSNDDLFYVDNIVINEMSYAWETTTATTNECVITGLEPATTYYVQVMGDCGDFGTSEWSEMISFTTTEDACPVPTNLAVNAETLTATTADLSWEGSPDVESFTVRYRIPEHASGGLYEPFNSNSIPAGWTRYSGLVNDVIAGTATLTTTTSGWYTTEYALGTYNMKVNIYGTSAKYWLVTPEVTLSSGNFSFDLALTDYNNSDPIEDATAQADDRFVVLVYANDAWTILREWNNTGSDYVYNTIATEGEAVSIDLSAYVGQTVKIAFYGESTASGGDNDLHIDNVVFGELVPATDWMTAEGITDMNVTLTGLTPETPYEAQVKADCSDPEAWSNTVTFTTPEQTTVTQTIALAEGFNWVSFNIDITLDDLKAALVEAMPGATSIKIQSKDKSVTYNGSRWRGQLTTLSVEQMYKIETQAECEITLEGMPLNPAEHPITINAGSTWIGFPFAANMSLTDAFAGFAVSGDKVSAKGQSASYNGTRWRGPLDTLVPGQGYVFESATDRTFVYPTGSSK